MVKSYDNMLSRFYLIPERHGQTDIRTDRHICYINIARQCADARRDKNPQCQAVSASHKEGMLNWWQTLKPETRV